MVAFHSWELTNTSQTLRDAFAVNPSMTSVFSPRDTEAGKMLHNFLHFFSHMSLQETDLLKIACQNECIRKRWMP